MSNKLVVIALGGNAINRPGQRGTAGEQLSNIRQTASEIIKIIKQGYQVVISHGNGPQIGNLMIQQQVGRSQVPPMPLDVCGSQTQGQLGYFIQQSLTNEMQRDGLERPVVSLVTQVLVREDDPAFANPEKPVGPFFEEEYAREMISTNGETWKEDSGRGWRRLVPSPRPVEILELDSIASLVQQGAIVIAAGGGGIPVIEKNGYYQGVEAVIDKDRATRQLAEELGADAFMILTDVPYAAINYGTALQEDLGVVSPLQMKQYLREGHFQAGSMGPKVESTLKFVENGGDKAIIASLENGYQALTADRGTIIR